jgi:hypothetical protein
VVVLARVHVESGSVNLELALGITAKRPRMVQGRAEVDATLMLKVCFIHAYRNAYF